MMRSIANVDLNQRTRSGDVRASLKRTIGPLIEGEIVGVVDRDGSASGEGKVAMLDSASGIAHIAIDWDSVRGARSVELPVDWSGPRPAA